MEPEAARVAIVAIMWSWGNADNPPRSIERKSSPTKSTQIKQATIHYKKSATLRDENELIEAKFTGGDFYISYGSKRDKIKIIDVRTSSFIAEDLENKNIVYRGEINGRRFTLTTTSSGTKTVHEYQVG